MLQKIGISSSDLSEYADLELGIKIRDCVKNQGYCNVDCEL